MITINSAIRITSQVTSSIGRESLISKGSAWTFPQTHYIKPLSLQHRWLILKGDINAKWTDPVNLYNSLFLYALLITYHSHHYFTSKAVPLKSFYLTGFYLFINGQGISISIEFPEKVHTSLQLRMTAVIWQATSQIPSSALYCQLLSTSLKEISIQPYTQYVWSANKYLLSLLQYHTHFKGMTILLMNVWFIM